MNTGAQARCKVLGELPKVQSCCRQACEEVRKEFGEVRLKKKGAG